MNQQQVPAGQDALGESTQDSSAPAASLAVALAMIPKDALASALTLLQQSVASQDPLTQAELFKQILLSAAQQPSALSVQAPSVAPVANATTAAAVQQLDATDTGPSSSVGPVQPALSPENTALPSSSMLETAALRCVHDISVRGSGLTGDVVYVAEGAGLLPAADARAGVNICLEASQLGPVCATAVRLASEQHASVGEVDKPSTCFGLINKQNATSCTGTDTAAAMDLPREDATGGMEGCDNAALVCETPASVITPLQESCTDMAVDEPLAAETVRCQETDGSAVAQEGMTAGPAACYPAALTVAANLSSANVPSAGYACEKGSEGGVAVAAGVQPELVTEACVKGLDNVDPAVDGTSTVGEHLDATAGSSMDCLARGPSLTSERVTKDLGHNTSSPRITSLPAFAADTTYAMHVDGAPLADTSTVLQSNVHAYPSNNSAERDADAGAMVTADIAVGPAAVEAAQSACGIAAPQAAAASSICDASELSNAMDDLHAIPESASASGMPAMPLNAGLLATPAPAMTASELWKFGVAGSESTAAEEPAVGVPAPSACTAPEQSPLNAGDDAAHTDKHVAMTMTKESSLPSPSTAIGKSVDADNASPDATRTAANLPGNIGDIVEVVTVIDTVSSAANHDSAAAACLSKAPADLDADMQDFIPVPDIEDAVTDNMEAEEQCVLPHNASVSEHGTSSAPSVIEPSFDKPADAAATAIACQPPAEHIGISGSPPASYSELCDQIKHEELPEVKQDAAQQNLGHTQDTVSTKEAVTAKDNADTHKATIARSGVSKEGTPSEVKPTSIKDKDRVTAKQSEAHGSSKEEHVSARPQLHSSEIKIKQTDSTKGDTAQRSRSRDRDRPSPRDKVNDRNRARSSGWEKAKDRATPHVSKDHRRSAERDSRGHRRSTERDNRDHRQSVDGKDDKRSLHPTGDGGSRSVARDTKQDRDKDGKAARDAASKHKLDDDRKPPTVTVQLLPNGRKLTRHSKDALPLDVSKLTPKKQPYTAGSTSQGLPVHRNVQKHANAERTRIVAHLEDEHQAKFYLSSFVSRCELPPDPCTSVSAPVFMAGCRRAEAALDARGLREVLTFHPKVRALVLEELGNMHEGNVPRHGLQSWMLKRLSELARREPKQAGNERMLTHLYTVGCYRFKALLSEASQGLVMRLPMAKRRVAILTLGEADIAAIQGDPEAWFRLTLQLVAPVDMKPELAKAMPLPVPKAQCMAVQGGSKVAQARKRVQGQSTGAKGASSRMQPVASPRQAKNGPATTRPVASGKRRRPSEAQLRNTRRAVSPGARRPLSPERPVPVHPPTAQAGAHLTYGEYDQRPNIHPAGMSFPAQRNSMDHRFVPTQEPFHAVPGAMAGPGRVQPPPLLSELQAQGVMLPVPMHQQNPLHSMPRAVMGLGSHMVMERGLYGGVMENPSRFPAMANHVIGLDNSMAQGGSAVYGFRSQDVYLDGPVERPDLTLGRSLDVFVGDLPPHHVIIGQGPNNVTNPGVTMSGREMDRNRSSGGSGEGRPAAERHGKLSESGRGRRDSRAGEVRPTSQAQRDPASKRPMHASSDGKQDSGRNHRRRGQAVPRGVHADGVDARSEERHTEKRPRREPSSYDQQRSGRDAAASRHDKDDGRREQHGSVSGSRDHDQGLSNRKIQPPNDYRRQDDWHGTVRDRPDTPQGNQRGLGNRESPRQAARDGGDGRNQMHASQGHSARQDVDNRPQFAFVPMQRMHGSFRPLDMQLEQGQRPSNLMAQGLGQPAFAASQTLRPQEVLRRSSASHDQEYVGADFIIDLPQPLPVQPQLAQPHPFMEDWDGDDVEHQHQQFMQDPIINPLPIQSAGTGVIGGQPSYDSMAVPASNAHVGLPAPMQPPHAAHSTPSPASIGWPASDNTQGQMQRDPSMFPGMAQHAPALLSNDRQLLAGMLADPSVSQQLSVVIGASSSSATWRVQNPARGHAEDASAVAPYAWGVADGVGATVDVAGISSAEYARKLVSSAVDIMNKAVTECISKGLSMPPCTHALSLAVQTVQNLQVRGATSAVLLAFDPGSNTRPAMLQAASIGACGFVVLRPNALTAEMEAVSSWRPYTDISARNRYISSPDLRQLIGGYDASRAVEERILLQPGDLIIAGSRGLFDMVWLHGAPSTNLRSELFQLVGAPQLMQPPQPPVISAQELSTKLASLACNLFQMDFSGTPLMQQLTKEGRTQNWTPQQDIGDNTALVAFVYS